jgi:hypothetical protein
MIHSRCQHACAVNSIAALNIMFVTDALSCTQKKGVYSMNYALLSHACDNEQHVYGDEFCMPMCVLLFRRGVHRVRVLIYAAASPRRLTKPEVRQHYRLKWDLVLTTRLCMLPVTHSIGHGACLSCWTLHNGQRKVSKKVVMAKEKWAKK